MSEENIFEIFNLLTMKWRYMIDEIQEYHILKWIERFYGMEWVKYMIKVFRYQKEVFAKQGRGIS